MNDLRIKGDPMIQECENRRDWLEARRSGIGASELAGILGRYGDAEYHRYREWMEDR